MRQMEDEKEFSELDLSLALGYLKKIRICCTTGLVIGSIIGLIIAYNIGGLEVASLYVGLVFGIWLGIGLGCFIAILTNAPNLFSERYEYHDSKIEALKDVLVIEGKGLIACIIFGPIAWLWTWRDTKSEIKKIKRCLSAEP